MKTALIRNFTWFIALCIVLLFQACEKPEALYPAPVASKGLQIKSFAMGENYENQLFFNFANQQMSSSAHGSWHLGFSSFGEKPHIIINGGLNAYVTVAHFSTSDFASITTKDHIKSANWRFDDPSGSLDSLAFGPCYSEQLPSGEYSVKSGLCSMDLGSTIHDSIRYVKIKLNSILGGAYHFQWGYLHESAPRKSVQVKIDPDYNYSYYNFHQDAVVMNEPVKSKEWDIVFTTYKDAVPDNLGVIYPYVIRGVLVNPRNVEVAEINGVNFNDISISHAENTLFTKVIDEIGYDWKSYDQTAERYTIVPNKNYLIKNADGNIFKLRFLDFYNDQGIKGFPKLAWELLK